MILSLRYTVTALALCALVACGLPAAALETGAKQAIIVDYDTGTVLLEKNADERVAPSSMSKLMTIAMVFKKLKEGKWKMDDQLPVSKTAWQRHFKSGGSTMFLPVGSSASVSDLLHGVIIQSGNDACSVLAEAHSGSEEAFAEDATRAAREMGLTRSSFRNASGWPEPDHLMTVRDLSILAAHLIRDYPEYYPIFAQKEFLFNKIRQGNRNPLLYSSAGADGLKTGHTEDGGYGLTASVKRGDRRLIMVLNGMASMKERAEESERLIEWAFREFENVALAKAGSIVADAEVWHGESATVPLMVRDDLILTLPRGARRTTEAKAVYDGPIAAPVRAGTVVGRLVLSTPGEGTAMEVPLIAAADVAKLGFLGRITANLNHMLQR